MSPFEVQRGPAETPDVHRGVQGADPGGVRRPARRQSRARRAAAPGRLYHSHLEHWRGQQHKGTLPATSGKPAKDPEAEELARLRAENKKLRTRNERLESELGKTRTALDIAGKAFALLEDISGSADPGQS
jgi:transposase-like protein